MTLIKQVRVALIERDPHYRLFLEGNISASPRHRLLRSGSDAAEAAQWPNRPSPQIILLEIESLAPNGIAAIEPLRSRFPDALLIVLTSRDDPATILDAIRAGAVGYVLKHSGKTAIFEAIDDALAGGSPLSPRVAREVLRLLRETSPASASPFGPTAPLPELTAREAQILALVAQGASDKLIGEQLGLARSTVKNAMLVVYSKWRVRTRTEAAVKYIRHAPLRTA